MDAAGTGGAYELPAAGVCIRPPVGAYGEAVTGAGVGKAENAGAAG